MAFLLHLWLPILLSAVFSFIASSLVHMLFKWHNSEYKKLTNEDEVRAAIRKENTGPGQYVIPYCMDMKDMGSAEMQQKYVDGPIGFLTLRPNGPVQMGPSLTSWFIFNIVVAIFAAYIASVTLPAGTHYLMVFRVVGSACFMAYGLGSIPEGIWMGRPWSAVSKYLLDALIYSLLTAGTFGWLWTK